MKKIDKTELLKNLNTRRRMFEEYRNRTPHQEKGAARTGERPAGHRPELPAKAAPGKTGWFFP